MSLISLYFVYDSIININKYINAVRCYQLGHKLRFDTIALKVKGQSQIFYSTYTTM